MSMNIENPYKQFSASKMSNNNRFCVSVEYKNLFGKTIRIECKTRKSMLEAQAFLKIFKSEVSKINRILAEYPVSMGKFPKKFHSEIKRDLTANGFGTIVKFILK